jgi:colicin import membrane protein
MAVKRSNNKYLRSRVGEPRLGRMLLISLGLHLGTLLLIYIGPYQQPSRKEIRPVYHVDLVNLPVANPQAGRPDAQPQPPKPAPKVAETPPAPPLPPPPEAVRLPEPVKPPPPKPAPPPVAKAEPKPIAPAKPVPVPVKPEPKVSAREEAAAQARIDQMRTQQEREALKRRLDELARGNSRAAAPASEAPLGMPTGRGSEAGVDEKTWLQAFFKENWRLSEYQVTRRDLQAVARVIYSAEGELLDYSLAPSGDAVFDDSVKRAILKEKKLPFRPGRRLELTDVIFNLKDLMDKP